MPPLKEDAKVDVVVEDVEVEAAVAAPVLQPVIELSAIGEEAEADSANEDDGEDLDEIEEEEVIVDQATVALLVDEGTIAYNCNNFQEAADKFMIAVQSSDHHHGAGNPQSAMIYMMYGLSIYELENKQTSLFPDGKLNGSQDEMAQSDGEEASSDEVEPSNEKSSSSKAIDPVVTSVVAPAETPVSTSSSAAAEALAPQIDEIKVSQSDSVPKRHSCPDSGSCPLPSCKDTAMDADIAASLATAIANAPNEMADGETEEKEASHYEIAFEVLTLAVEGFKQQAMDFAIGSPDHQKIMLNIARCQTVIAEIYMEWVNFEEAMAVVQEALDIRVKLLEEGNRLITSLMVLKGNIMAQLNNEQEGVAVLNGAINQMKGRITSLTDKEGHENEVKDLGKFIADVEKQIEEIQGKKEVDAAIAAEKLQEQVEITQAANIVKSPKKMVNDISALVKRKVPLDVTMESPNKRKTDSEGDVVSGSENPAKKLKEDDQPEVAPSIPME